MLGDIETFGYFTCKLAFLGYNMNIIVPQTKGGEKNHSADSRLFTTVSRHILGMGNMSGNSAWWHRGALRLHDWGE